MSKRRRLCGQATWTTAPPRREPTAALLRYGESKNKIEERTMGRGLLLWLIGIPLPIILVVWLLGGLH